MRSKDKLQKSHKKEHPSRCKKMAGITNPKIVGPPFNAEWARFPLRNCSRQKRGITDPKTVKDEKPLKKDIELQEWGVTHPKSVSTAHATKRTKAQV